MKNYIIELRGVEFHNKGAELMLHAILEKLRLELPEALFVMEKRGDASIANQRKVGIYTKLNMKKYGIDAAFWGNLVPSSMLKSIGFVLEKDINIVLDGSGFAFGDFWGADKAGTRLANHVERWSGEGKKIIMLSQAFGPFKEPLLRAKMATILNNTQLVFARDKYSYKYIRDIKAKQSHVYLRPDFTNLISGILPSNFDSAKCEFAIIPNNKLLESSTFKSRELYIEFLTTIISTIQKRGKNPFFLIHEGVKDLKIAEETNESLNEIIPVLTVENPLEVKGIIGNSVGVVTSRFHGLVSALSQGVPCLCVGWSHKYLALMEDYEYSEGLIDPRNNNEQLLSEKLDLLLNPVCHTRVHEKLKKASSEQKELAIDMWNIILKRIKD
ncbi:polysaccharide pyruvyl transferase family protein [Dyadobacter arcticus]|uniref:Colanic acid/amylovoran biosynthesis protein n=1 Tax=Dyadobacter arcticus TaxID=1078754 RepID=A0ABX0UPR2_9BACT|nr:polysaccharide pyruvyl transferase family protein [Dyadobacter arcticus]NIJ54977.1 colanic acid/amylovoran biosynthesis protein [Dyadobacter arcticus]